MPASSRQTSLPGMEPDEPASKEPATEASVPKEASSPPENQPESLKGWKICLVDSHSLIFQVFHALPEMTSPQGEPVGAVYGFARDIFQLLEICRPDALICAFDLPGPTFRHELYDAYKADRGSMPEDLKSQIPKIRETLAALGIPVLACPGFEADDVLATVSQMVDRLEAECLIVTGDKDCRQLITDQVSIYNIRKNSVYDAGSLQDDWGIRPDQVVDFQSLVGDKVDNVPGVPLIGPKMAKELLEKYDNLDTVLAHAEEVAGAKRRQNLIEYRDDALMSKTLVKLSQDVPVTPDWNASRIGNVDHAKLKELFKNFGFRTLGERATEMDGFGRGDSAPGIEKAEKVSGDYQIVDTLELFEEFVETLKKQTLISIDTETTDISPRNAKIVGYAIAFEPGEGYYIPVRGPEGDTVLDAKHVADELRPVLEDASIAKIGQNLKYDIVVLRGADIKLSGIVFDTMVASYLLDAGERSHNLDQLASRYLDHTTVKIDSLIGKGKNQKRMDEVPVADVGPYAAEDADIPLQLYPLLSARLEENGLTELNETIEVPLIEILAEMEYLGISVDTGRLSELSTQYGARLEELAVEIEEMAGHPLNIRSPKQLGQLLFEELGLPVIKKTKTGPSTDASVLEELAGVHPLPAKIVEYRQFSKLLNTYVDALPEMVHAKTGRVHASFNQVVAATGRLSSSNPNLQNIPIRTAEGREIRSAFRAGNPGWKLLAADYSQVELRVLAHLSSDHAMCEAFANDEDIHTLVASHVEGVSLSDVTSEMRRRAKAVNFGIIYGQSPFGLAKALSIPQEEAAEFIETYFASYPGVLDFMTDTLNTCREQGYVSTMLGRKRAVQGVRPVPEGLREAKSGALRQLNLPERTAVNTVIQGSAADLIKIAMIGVQRRLPVEIPAASMLLQIHDELVFEVAPESIDPLARLVVEEMSQVQKLEVPLKIDVKYGDNWAECEPWDEAD